MYAEDGKRRYVDLKGLRWALGAAFAAVLLTLLFSAPDSASGGVMVPGDAININFCYGAEISPDGSKIAYVVARHRSPDEEPGGRHSELYVVDAKSGEIRPFITGKVNVRSPRWSPDGSVIAFLTARGDEAKTQVWMIPVDGGESRQVTHSKTGVSNFRWHPSGGKIAYIATTPPTDREKELEEKGYDFVFFEENLKHRNLYIIDVNPEEETDAEQLTEGVTVWDLEFNPDGTKIAASVSPKNLIDYRYMFRKIYLLDLRDKELTRLTDNPGKLGNYAFSPDSKKLAYTAALERRDHAVSQVYVMDLEGGEQRNLTVPGFRGHVDWVGWKDKNTIVYHAGEGVWPTLSQVNADGGKRKIILDSSETGVVFDPPSISDESKHFAFIGTTPGSPDEVYYWKHGSEPRVMSENNPWVAERDLGRQEVVRYSARDGQEIEGLLIYPVGYKEGTRYPLIVTVHGGPEAHYSNGWVTSYGRPGQILAGAGYAVFYPNYRASTGYGVEFALAGYEEAAGVEFDDVADGIDHLVQIGLADEDRVGLGGGSYGGYAAAWFSSYYTEKVRAVMMFVGISDLISKRGTTDIPYEELYVHSGTMLEKTWQKSLERSPVYWAHQSKTAVLIIGGTADTRVHPSQSLEYFRRLKMNDHPAVRMVQYPGEGHGNRKQTGQLDVINRVLRWYDWYVKDAKPLDGPMPPLDISDTYGIDLDDSNGENEH